jgi:hypothetical protein
VLPVLSQLFLQRASRLFFSASRRHPDEKGVRSRQNAGKNDIKHKSKHVTGMISVWLLPTYYITRRELAKRMTGQHQLKRDSQQKTATQLQQRMLQLLEMQEQGLMEWTAVPVWAVILWSFVECQQLLQRGQGRQIPLRGWSSTWLRLLRKAAWEMTEMVQQVRQIGQQKKLLGQLQRLVQQQRQRCPCPKYWPMILGFWPLWIQLQ